MIIYISDRGGLKRRELGAHSHAKVFLKLDPATMCRKNQISEHIFASVMLPKSCENIWRGHVNGGTIVRDGYKEHITLLDEDSYDLKSIGKLGC